MLLLDTCTFLWLVFDQPELSETAREQCLDASVELYLSSVSAWEIALRWRLGKLPLTVAPREFVPRYREAHGILELPLTEAAAVYESTLPHLHRDPFDRMLVCQSIEHGLTILTPDAAISQYPVRYLW